MNLADRTFRNRDFFNYHQNVLIPAGLAFFQSDYDSSLKNFFHNVLEMKEPRYEYHFTTPYVTPWSTMYPVKR